MNFHDPLKPARLFYSTISPRPRNLFVSASDALGELFRLQSKIESCQAIDYEKISENVGISSSKQPSGPCVDSLDLLLDLKSVFKLAAESCDPDSWKIWCEVRISLVTENRLAKKLKLSRYKISKTVVKIDLIITDILADKEMFVWIPEDSV